MTTELDTTKWRILIDLPKKNPELGFREQARALVNMLVNSQPRFAMGIFGSWGSGKTTLMNAVRDRLPTDRTIVAEFCAWRYEKDSHILVPFLEALRCAMENWTTENVTTPVEDAVRTAAKNVGRVCTALIAGLSGKVNFKLFELSFDGGKALAKAEKLGEEAEKEARTAIEAALSESNMPRSLYHGTFQALQDTFAQFRAQAPHLRFVVFVDDLDRCLPKSMLDMLEAMKLFFDLSGFVFVVGVDKDVIQWAIEQRYDGKLVHGADYLNKIFQVPFNLPVIRTSQVKALLRSFEEEAELPDSQSRMLHEKVAEHLSWSSPGPSINPRTIKRYINNFSIQMMVRPELNPDAVLALATLESRNEWRPVYAALLAEDLGFHAYLRNLVGGSSTEQEADPDFPAITQDLVAYLSGPGRELVSTDDISSYLYSAALVMGKTDGDRELHDFAAKVVRFRAAASKAKSAGRDSAQQDITDALECARELLPLPEYPGWSALYEQIQDTLNSVPLFLAGERDLELELEFAKRLANLGEKIKRFAQSSRRARDRMT